MKAIEKAVYEGIRIEVLCIGTPRVIGDSVGPMVGSLLSLNHYEADVRIIGTMDQPVVKRNYVESIKTIRSGAFIIVVDAVISDTTYCWDFHDGYTFPGIAMGYDFMPVGHVSVKACIGPTLDHFVHADKGRVAGLAHDISYRLMTLLKATE